MYKLCFITRNSRWMGYWSLYWSWYSNHRVLTVSFRRHWLTYRESTAILTKTHWKHIKAWIGCCRCLSTWFCSLCLKSMQACFIMAGWGTAKHFGNELLCLISNCKSILVAWMQVCPSSMPSMLFDKIYWSSLLLFVYLRNPHLCSEWNDLVTLVWSVWAAKILCFRY